MELKAKVVQVLIMQTGQGKKGVWRKQEYVLETNGQYPKKVCVSVWNDNIDKWDMEEGMTLTAHLEIESREYNGRWYTEVKIWKVEDSNRNGVQQRKAEPVQDSYPSNTTVDYNDIPF